MLAFSFTRWSNEMEDVIVGDVWDGCGFEFSFSFSLGRFGFNFTFARHRLPRHTARALDRRNDKLVFAGVLPCCTHT